MPDPALQKRTGKNTGPSPVFLYPGNKGSGDISKVIANQDNVLVAGLRDAVRISGVVPCCFYGALFNRNGLGVGPGDVSFDVVFIDAQGNEIVYQSGTVIDGGSPFGICTPNCACCGPFGLVEGEKIVLRITGGNPSAGDGVVFVPMATQDSVTAISPRAYVTGRGRVVVAQPPPGKIWQMPIAQVYPCGAACIGINFDAVNLHSFNCYLVNGQTGDEVLLSAGDNVAANSIANLFSDIVSSHMFPYPYRLEVQSVDANPFAAPFLIASFFIEFDLPKDLG